MTRSQAAKNNLRAGIKKMEAGMSTAAVVRREFTRGRPPKLVEGDMQPSHRAVVWRKAQESLSDLRGRMVTANLRPQDVEGAIVYIEHEKPDTPRFLELQRLSVSEGQVESESLAVLGRDDVIALGMIFTQVDAQAGKFAYFPLLFTGLNARGMAVLKSAAEIRRQEHTAALSALSPN